MDAMKDLRAFILIMVILAFVWLFTGGPLRPSTKSGWFLNKPQQKAIQKRKNKQKKFLEQKVLPLNQNFNHLPAKAQSGLTLSPLISGEPEK